MDLLLEQKNHDAGKVTTLVSLLRKRVQEMGDRTAYQFLKEGEQGTDTITFDNLEYEARTIAARLQRTGDPGDRVLLAFPPGLDFIAALFGTFYAGMIAVPVNVPRPNKSLSRLQSIVKDSNASRILAISSVLERLDRQMEIQSQAGLLEYIATDTIQEKNPDAWKEPSIFPDSLALLQYTSGSTGTPKGVMVSHGNLLHNLGFTHRFFGNSRNTRLVNWLPHFHDMGLISVIQPVFGGFPMVLMSPVHFVQKPVRWLRAISRFKATTSGGPNFAYDLCVQKITPEQMEGLDLSTWERAFNGAEPVRIETLDRFSHVFGPVGFCKKAFYPCYGMAESTLMITGATRTKEPGKLTIDTQALEINRIVPVLKAKDNGRCLISCGSTSPDQKLLIVDPEKRIPCASNSIGEIWISGPSVAKGYWNQAENTEYTFHAKLSNTGEGPFLRTGDLGFVRDGELFVTGRLKDLIIIRGLNHYPQDIESTVGKSHIALKSDASAAFSIDVKGEERLIIVQEVERVHIRNLDIEKVSRAIRKAVSKEHELQVYAISLIKPFSIPKTSSGKIQRRVCKSEFLNNTLKIVAQRIGYAHDEETDRIDTQLLSLDEILNIPDPGNRVRNLENYFRNEVAKVLKVPIISIDSRSPLNELGLDSLLAVELKTRLEAGGSVSLSEEALFQGASIHDIVGHINYQIVGKNTGHPYRHISPNDAEFTQNEENAAKHVDTLNLDDIPEKFFQFEAYPEYLNLQNKFREMQSKNLENPFFKAFEGVNSHTARFQGRNYINFSSYNYLGLCGHPLVSKAAKEAIENYGTSVSASRVASGERPLHRKLERALADLMGTEDAIAYVGGHATNVTTVGHLFGRNDLIAHDSLIHNSILQGCTLSGASQLPFAHNDWQSLDNILHEYRNRFHRVLIVIEGIYSMDGDIPDLPKFIEIKKRHKTFLMVDEAHSIGVLGKTGKGIREHFDVDPNDVDLWMGTLSKSFAGCGGYIAARHSVVEYLKYTAPGFVYSVGMSPPNTAAALAAVELLKKEPERIKRLRERIEYFLEIAREKGLKTLTGKESPVIPLIIGNSLTTMKVSQALFSRGVNVQPMVYPAVPEKSARLRFFLNCTHTKEQIRTSLDLLERELKKNLEK